ncbi:AAA family ATPase [Nocardioides aurantiacus]|uniref:Putative kinase n=1 Tax=Nocardioides aurantiacus TaxID=86796 RepID=A0A3N2CXS4_9ACTN|nr:AAA family ATPase [Nocardioides aurantiacus]ROR92286.1 putative kinase [Nocardioides aurantiacus]
MYVVLTGPPASGKSTLAAALAVELGLPLLAKDTLKQGLVDVLGAADVAISRALGRAAVVALLAVAREARSGVLDSVWVDRARALEQLGELGVDVEVHCRVDVPTLRERYAARAATKGPGHFDADRPEDELWPPEARAPLAGGWPVVEVDTSAPVDVPALARDVIAIVASRPRS